MSRVASPVKQPLQRHAPFAAGRPSPAAAPGPTLPGGPARAARATASAEIGRFFVELRWALGVPTRQLAERLATSERVIKALEAGRTADLPVWPETVRIVSDYAALARIDARPVLHVIAGALAAAQRQAPHADVPDGRRNLAATPRTARASERLHHRLRAGIGRLVPTRIASGEPGAMRRRPPLKTLLAVAAPTALWLFATETNALYRGLASLPPSAQRLVRPVQDYLLLALAPVREGHRWIEVDDPRSRRSAKLPTKRR
ncbi:MAG: hypothetical protein AB1749_11230 [Pseudomonadota bacterium]